MYKERIRRIIAEMNKLGIGQLMVTDPDSIFYLTDIINHPMERFWAFLIREDGSTVLFANKLFRLKPIDGELVLFDDIDPLADIVCAKLADAPLGVDGNMAARFLIPFMEKLPGMKPVLATDCINHVRACKDAQEKEYMRISSQINDRVMAKAAAYIHEGMTEKECSEYLSRCYAEEGATGYAFPPIVSFGANAADPHHFPDNTVLQEGNCIVIDMGCQYHGYCSDMTRTFYWKTVSEEDKKIYEITLKANLLAEEKIKAGRMFKEIDLAGRDHITACGYGPYFTHRLGHSIGLADHEGEDVSSVNEHLIQPDMCFSVEPGIYLPGKTGVRIEDLVIATEDGCELLNFYSKELTILGR